MTESQTLFINMLAQTGNVTAAAQRCHIARSTAYYWRQHDPAFAAAWEDAMAEATDKLALEARRRALEGVEEVRYFKGEALDFVPLDPATGKGRFDRGLAVEVAVAFLDAGQELAIPFKWGGMWHRFEDIPHFELIHSGGRPR